MTDTNLDQFVQDAIRTESRIEEVNVNPTLLVSVVAMAVASGNMLDQIKKHVFYGKEYDEQGFIEGFTEIVGALDLLKGAFPNRDEEEPLDIDPRMFHAIVGIATEATELLEAISTGDELDLINVQEELGDLNWYQAIAIDSIEGASFDNVLMTVINKLKERYPDKFTSKDAINRDLDNERKTLQDNLLADD